MHMYILNTSYSVTDISKEPNSFYLRLLQKYCNGVLGRPKPSREERKYSCVLQQKVKSKYKTFEGHSTRLAVFVIQEWFHNHLQQF